MAAATDKKFDLAKFNGQVPAFSGPVKFGSEVKEYFKGKECRFKVSLAGDYLVRDDFPLVLTLRAGETRSGEPKVHEIQILTPLKRIDLGKALENELEELLSSGDEGSRITERHMMECYINSEYNHGILVGPHPTNNRLVVFDLSFQNYQGRGELEKALI